MYGLFAGYFLGADATPFPPLHFTMQTSSSAKTSEAGTGFFSAVFREDRRPRDDAGENDDRRDDGQDAHQHQDVFQRLVVAELFTQDADHDIPDQPHNDERQPDIGERGNIGVDADIDGRGQQQPADQFKHQPDADHRIQDMISIINPPKINLQTRLSMIKDIKNKSQSQ